MNDQFENNDDDMNQPQSPDQIQQEQQHTQESQGDNESSFFDRHKKGVYVLLFAFLVFIALWSFKGGLFGSSNVKAKASSVPANIVPMSTKETSRQVDATHQQQHENILSQTDVENIVKEYIMDNPEVIVESMQNFQKKAMVEQANRSKEYIKNNINTITDGQPFIGNKGASITIVEFFDYKCGYCKKGNAVLEKLIQNDTDVKVVLYALPMMGEQSSVAAKAFNAAWQVAPNKFAQFNKALMNLSDINQQSIASVATKVGINPAVLSKSMSSDAVQQKLTENIMTAQNLGIQGIPAFIINGELITSFLDYDQLQTKIKSTRDALPTQNVSTPNETNASKPSVETKEQNTSELPLAAGIK